jgi:hypothetical protein
VALVWNRDENHIASKQPNKQSGEQAIARKMAFGANVPVWTIACLPPLADGDASG